MQIICVVCELHTPMCLSYARQLYRIYDSYIATNFGDTNKLVNYLLLYCISCRTECQHVFWMILTVYPKKYALGFCFAVLCCGYTLTDFPFPSGLLHWHCGNLTIAPVPAKQPWWIWINTSCEFIMNDCITTTKQSTTKPCAYFLGYTVRLSKS